MKITIKARDDWQLDVLGVPYGNRQDKDSDGEYFTRATELHDDKFPLPPVVYYHGYTPEGKPKGSPEYIGKTVGFEDKEDGRWYRVVLDKTNRLARRVWEAAKQGKANASSGSISHLVRRATDGRIKEWPVGELSVFDIGQGRQPANAHAVALPVLKAVYEQAGLTMPDYVNDGHKSEGQEAYDSAMANDVDTTMVENNSPQEKIIMDNEQESNNALDIQAMIASALKADREAQQAERDAEVARKQEIDEAVKAERKQWEEEAAKSNRLPYNAENAPTVAKFGDTYKFDNLNDAELAFTINVLQEGQRSGRSREGASDASIKALAIRVVEGDNRFANEARHYLKARGITDAVKANEVQYSTLASYGNDFVPTFNSATVWANIVEESMIAGKLPAVTVPQGSESITIPVEGANPTFYKVAQATAQTSNLGSPTATVTSSKKGTSSNTLSVAKMGASTLWTGELEEDSIVPWAGYIRNALVQEGAYTLDHVIIDGDTETGASTNINDIAATPAGTEAFLMFDGFRKSCLVTTTANSRDGGVLDENDFLETIKLMGLAGKNALSDKGGTSFIMDLWTYWKALGLAAVKTKDVYSNPTMENGELVRIWGYEVLKSAHMHRANQDATYGLKANTAGKVDLDTASNNTTGALLAVRWDQWLLGYKRMMTIETQRYANADTTEIVALMRVGLAQRDTEASAITYNITV